MEDGATRDISAFFQDVKRIGFLGFGKTNRALFELLRTRTDLEFVIRDERESLPGVPAGRVKLLLGKRCFERDSENVILLSPSVRRERQEVMELAKEGAVISSDAELFFSCKPKNVLAVTGSDGKSTTTSLAAAILKESGHDAHACGNLGLPMTPLLKNKDAFFVTELSSFMLRYMKPHSRRATVTNLTPNHLNWHASLDEYREAKMNIYENADECVLCADMSPLTSKRAYAVFSAEQSFRELKCKLSAEAYFTFESGILCKNGTALVERACIPLVGIHGTKNALAALALTDGFCDTDAAVRALTSFRGLPHRCELVDTFLGIRYYDSSIDSTPERTKTTLEVFSSPVTVILGGRNKGLSYEPLVNALKLHAEAAVLLGENADELSAYLRDKIPCPIYKATDMRDAVEIASGLGSDVLLSPAATSFDRYSGFEERGLDFKRAVGKLKN